MTAARLEQDDGEGRYVLTGELTFDSVPQLAMDTRDRIEDGSELRIDLGGVERVDSAGLALLVEWARQARRSGRAIRFERTPDQLLAIAEVSGLDKILPFYGEVDTEA